MQKEEEEWVRGVAGYKQVTTNVVKHPPSRGDLWLIPLVPNCLAVHSPSVNQPADNQAADATRDENRSILMRDNGVRQADEKAKYQAHNPAWHFRQLHTPNDKSDREAAGERAE